MPSAVPPQFAKVYLALSSPRPTRVSPAEKGFAVTGNPVPVYFRPKKVNFFGSTFRATFGAVNSGGFQPAASPSLAGHQPPTPPGRGLFLMYGHYTHFRHSGQTNPRFTWRPSGPMHVFYRL
jgi:hypothetical protein